MKAVILTGLADGSGAGVSNMTFEGWFNLAAAWLVFGVPGALFALLAVRHGRRPASSRALPAASSALGIAALAAIGLAIG